MTDELRAAIRPVKSRVEDELISRPGVNAVDIAEKITDGKPTGELSIVVYVDKKVPQSRLTKAQAIPAEIDGVRTDVQEMKIELQPAMERLDVSAQIDAGVYSTLVGGISMGPARSIYLTPPDVTTAGNYIFAGTLGALVKDNASGRIAALSNFHVAAVTTTWSTSDRQVQPGRLDGGNPTTQSFGTLARAVISDHVDGSVTLLDTGKAWEAQVTEIGWVKGTAAAVVGQAVRKRGRTTELTYGSVASVDFTVSVPYGDGVGTRTLRNQLRITPDTSRSARFSDHGDSGSVIMNDTNHVVGLLFAGANDGSATFANPIANVLSELNVTMLTGPTIVATRPAICPVVTKPVICPVRTLSVVNCPIRTVTVLCRPSTLLICRPTTTVLCRPTLVAACIRTLACQTGVACIPDNPGGPIERYEGDYGYGDDQYGAGFEAGYQAATGADDTDVESGGVDAGFWAGYLAALEQQQQ